MFSIVRLLAFMDSAFNDSAPVSFFDSVLLSPYARSEPEMVCSIKGVSLMSSFGLTTKFCRIFG